MLKSRIKLKPDNDMPTTKPRINAIDCLRGLMLVLMTLVHLPGEIGVLINRFSGYCGPAEGFVFLSAILIGIFSKNWRYKTDLYYAKITKIYRRVSTLYLINVLTILTILLINNLGLNLSRPWDEFGIPDNQNLLKSGLSTFLLLYQPRYLDIFPLFCGLLLITPFVLGQFHKGRSTFILFFSISFWALSLFVNLTDLLLPKLSTSFFTYHNQSPFNFFSWQLLFIIGILIGQSQFYKSNLIKKYSTLSSSFAITTICFAILLGYNIIVVPTTPFLNKFFFDKQNLGLFRIIELLSIAWILYRITLRQPELISNNWLEFLGRHSMKVYLFHIYLLYFTAPFRIQWHFVWSWGIQIVATILALFAMSLCVRMTTSYNHRRKIIKT